METDSANTLGCLTGPSDSTSPNPFSILNHYMKSSILLAGLLATFTTVTSADAAPPANVTPVAEFSPNLIPWPAKIARRDGSFTLAGNTTIQADDAFAAEATKLAAALSIQLGPGSGIALKKVAGLAAEGYTLEVTPKGITISATTPAGAFYGGQTLRQLVSGQNVPCCSIQDEPRIPWRGFMLDVSRHFFDKAEVKARIDEMAELKLNVFHWHLTDDHGWRIEIKKYPKLTTTGAWRPLGGWDKDASHIVNGQHGGFYTQDDIREIVAYAAARHIRIMPEIDMPGHMSAAATAYPELSPANGWTPKLPTGGEYCAALCVARPQTVQFCKDVLEEVIALFPSKEIHVGGDEVFTEQWQACPEMRAFKEKLKAKDWEDVQIAFQNDISEFLIQKGRTAVFWNNIYRQSVDKRSINHFWRNMNDSRNFANNGFDVLMSPYVYYLDHREFSPEATYKYDPLAIGVKAGEEKHMIGIEACQWTERIPNEHALARNIHPRLIAIAESGWTPDEQKDWESFRKRVVHCKVLPDDLRNKLDEETSKIDFKPFRSALAGMKLKDGQKPMPIPAGNLACWKSARLLNLDETKAVPPASETQSADKGIDGNLATVALAKNAGNGWIYEVDLESMVMVKHLKITFGTSPALSGLQVGVSADGIVWNTIYNKIPADGAPLTLGFNPAETRFVRVVQTAPNGKPEKTANWMTIAEIEVN